jgi:ATP-dependent Clp protease ATP-binding subunit ClpB
MGSHLIQENFEKMNERNKEEIIAKTKVEVFELLKKSIRPEFLNRIDETIMFTPLNRDDVNKIVELQFNGIKQSLEENDIFLSATPQAIEWLAQLGFDPQFGARPVKRVIQKRVLNELSKQILAGKVEKNAHIVLDVFNNEFVFRNEIETDKADKKIRKKAQAQ